MKKSNIDIVIDWYKNLNRQNKITITVYKKEKNN